MSPELTPVDWAKRPIVEKYADFTGRASRPELWWFVLALVVAFIVARIVESIVGLGYMFAGAYGPLTSLLWLATIVPAAAVGVRRLHDTNRPGWWLLLWLVPWALTIVVRFMYAGAGVYAMMGMMGLIGLISLIGAIVLIVFYCLPGTPGDNQYGPPPLAGDGTAIPAE